MDTTGRRVEQGTHEKRRTRGLQGSIQIRERLIEATIADDLAHIPSSRNSMQLALRDLFERARRHDLNIDEHAHAWAALVRAIAEVRSCHPDFEAEYDLAYFEG